MSDAAQVRVRIAVVVDDEGNWSAIGWGRLGNHEAPYDSEMVKEAVENGFFDDHAPRFTAFVEAEVDLPQWPPTLAGRVLRAAEPSE